MSVNIVLVEHRKDWPAYYPAAIVVEAEDYLAQQEYHRLKDVRVINLCRSYSYLSMGYYCSLLAEARRHRIIPSVRTITDLSSKAIYGLAVEDLEELVRKSLKKHAGASDTFELYIFFGRCRYRDLQELARNIFDLYRCPLLRVEFRFHGTWGISAIRAVSIASLSEELEEEFIDACSAYMTKRWYKPKTKSLPRYDLAILRDPEEKLPPSNERSLRKFVMAGKKMGIGVDLIDRKDYGRLAEYDALFIRETTRIDHHTYRFSKKAESEGMVVVDDPDSIVRCTNKVFLAELFLANRIPVPKTVVLQVNDVRRIRKVIGDLDFPLVLKIPDGSFSRGIFKVETMDQLREKAGILFKESDLIILQEFVATEFDWRIGIFNGVPLFACQYFMPKKHWQIVKHGRTGRVTTGDFKTWLVEDVPKNVVKTALKAGNLIGMGLYGVDIKQTARGLFVMEVNDNPNIDAGVEDKALGDDLYRMIMAEFLRRLDLLNHFSR